jgi:hypothetical protein
MCDSHFPGEARRQDLLSTVTMAGSGPSTASPSSMPSNIILIPLKQPNLRTSQRITSTNFTNTNIPSVVSGFQTGYHFYLSPSLSFPYIYEFSSISFQAFSIRSLFTAAFCALTFCLSFLYHQHPHSPNYMLSEGHSTSALRHNVNCRFKSLHAPIYFVTGWSS